MNFKLILFALFVSFITVAVSFSSCEKTPPNDIDLPDDNNDTIINEDSLRQLRILAITALLDSVEGEYGIMKRKKKSCLACPPPLQFVDTLYPGTTQLFLTQIHDTILQVYGADLTDTLLLSFYKRQYGSGPEDENLEYDPDIRMGYMSTHDSKILSLFENDSISLPISSWGLGGSYNTYYFGKKMP
jgi:hypothetical protein